MSFDAKSCKSYCEVVVHAVWVCLYVECISPGVRQVYMYVCQKLAPLRVVYPNYYLRLLGSGVTRYVCLCTTLVKYVLQGMQGLIVVCPEQL